MRTLAVLALLLAAPASRAAHPIVGAWRLTSFRVEGRPFCPGERGTLTYTARGRVHLGIDCAANTPADAPAAKFGNRLHYSGTYEVKGREVAHRIRSSSHEPFVGQVLTRAIESVDRHTLVLTGSVGQNFRIVWRRP